MEYGASFYKCALQVNPASYSSYQGQNIEEEVEYNNSIIEKCKNNTISIVGLADHGRVDTSQSLREALEAAGIIVFPGFEIASAEKIHIICLFPPESTSDELNRYLGTLGLRKVGIGNEASSLSCLEIGRIVTDELDGFWFGAHVTSDNGILKTGKMQHIWKDKALVAVQIPNNSENIDPKYINILKNTNKDYKRIKSLALINAKDISSPQDLDDKSASVLVKMSVPSFYSFKNAFKDPDSRIRLNYDVEDSYQSCIKAIRVYGGYMEDLEIKFSDNLTTLIGGRGTGKSTLIGLIRYALDVSSTNKEMHKENDELIKNNLGSNGRIELDLVSNKQYGGFFTIVKRYDQRVVVKDKLGNVSNLSVEDIMPNIEIYGQNEIMSSISDPSIINKIISRLFITNDILKNLEQNIVNNYEDLEKNTQKLKDIEVKIEKGENDVGDLLSLKERLTYYDIAGISSKLNTVDKTASTDALFTKFENKFSKIDIKIPSLSFSSVDKSQEYYLQLYKLSNIYNIAIKKIEQEYDTVLDTLQNNFSTIKSEWNIKKKDFEIEIKIALRNIPDIQDKNSTQILTDYKYVVEQVTIANERKKDIDNINTEKELLLIERKDIIEILKQLLDKKDECFSKQLKKINKNKLNGKLRVDLLFRQDKRNIIDNLIGINGVGEKSLQGIINYADFDIFTFVQDIEEDIDLKEKYNINLSMENRLKKLSSINLRDIEGIILEDEPIIQLEVKGNFKKLENLSKGQQCTAILNILLLDNKDPLIIDQPEDNLDNAFIADSLVETIRKNKLSRQYIFATHNANIPVFGDAELIVSLEEVDGKGKIITNGIGAIDSMGVKEQVVNILEGGEWAFKMREEKYGLN